MAATDLEARLYELFVGKEELLPLWLRLRSHVESFGSDVRTSVRDRYVEFDRVGIVFAIAEPTAHRRMKLGLRTPGLAYDDRFHEPVSFGARRVTHETVLREDAEIDGDLHARLHVAYELAREG